MTDDLARYRADLTGNDPEEELAGQMRMVGLPTPDRQFRFHLTRKWRADFRWPTLIVEVDGGAYIHGRHTTGRGYEDDRERDAEAMMMGYRVLRVTPKQVTSGQALAWIEALLK
jgi:very-short-patch-repair endonuclease